MPLNCDRKIAIIGLGVMGQSILNGFVQSGLVLLETLRATSIPEMIDSVRKSNPGLVISVDNQEAIEWANIVIFW